MELEQLSESTKKRLYLQRMFVLYRRFSFLLVSWQASCEVKIRCKFGVLASTAAEKALFFKAFRPHSHAAQVLPQQINRIFVM